MGTTLSITTGLGFAAHPAIVTAYEEAHEDDYFYEYLEGLVGYDGPLELDVATYYDYTPAEDDKRAYAVFLKSTVTTNYGAGVFPAPGPLGADYVPEEYEAIIQLAETLGMKDVALEWLTVVSLG